jgi:ornithine cyclodeaminase
MTIPPARDHAPDPNVPPAVALSAVGGEKEPQWVTPRFLTAADLWRALPVEAAVDALRHGFTSRTPEQVEGTPRSVLQVENRAEGDEGEMLLMPASGPEGAGLKLVTITRGNRRRDLPLIQGLYVLLTRDGLTPELVIDGAGLTGLRTAAVSALATKYLANPESSRLVVFGAGAQAGAHIAAMRAILPIQAVTVVGSSTGSRRAAELVANLEVDGIDAVVGDAASVSEADVVCCCTTSPTPVFADGDLRAGTHVNAIGAYRLDLAEVPAASLARALLVVESVEATLTEAGDVVAAIEAGALPQAGFAHELQAVLRGTIGRQSDEQITVFKSVGLSVEDLIVARAAADALAKSSD